MGWEFEAPKQGSNYLKPWGQVMIELINTVLFNNNYKFKEGSGNSKMDGLSKYIQTDKQTRVL